jgi:hypothetical protein
MLKGLGQIPTHFNPIWGLVYILLPATNSVNSLAICGCASKFGCHLYKMVRTDRLDELAIVGVNLVGPRAGISPPTPLWTRTLSGRQREDAMDLTGSVATAVAWLWGKAPARLIAVVVVAASLAVAFTAVVVWDMTGRVTTVRSEDGKVEVKLNPRNLPITR